MYESYILNVWHEWNTIINLRVVSSLNCLKCQYFYKYFSYILVLLTIAKLGYVSNKSLCIRQWAMCGSRVVVSPLLIYKINTYCLKNFDRCNRSFLNFRRNRKRIPKATVLSINFVISNLPSSSCYILSKIWSRRNQIIYFFLIYSKIFLLNRKLNNQRFLHKSGSNFFNIFQ